MPALPQANYVFVKIANSTGRAPGQIYVSVATKTQAYGYDQY